MLNPFVLNEMVALRCGECGINFMVPDFWKEARSIAKENGGAFFCPNGHGRVFRETEVDRLNRELATEKRLRFEAQARAGQEEAKRTKLEKRIKCGVCPYCRRSFERVARHIATKHPDKARP